MKDQKKSPDKTPKEIDILLDKAFAIYQDSVKSLSAGSSFTSPGYLIYIHGFNYYTPRGANKKYPRSTKKIVKHFHTILLEAL